MQLSEATCYCVTVIPLLRCETASHICVIKTITVLEVACYKFRPRTSSSGDTGAQYKTKTVLVFKEISFIQNFLVISEWRGKSISWLGTAKMYFLFKRLCYLQNPFLIKESSVVKLLKTSSEKLFYPYLNHFLLLSTSIDNKVRELATLCLPWQHWTNALVVW